MSVVETNGVEALADQPEPKRGVGLSRPRLGTAPTAFGLDTPRPVQMEISPGVTLLFAVSDGSTASVYRLDQLDNFPVLSERDRAVADGLVEAVAAKLRALR